MPYFELVFPRVAVTVASTASQVSEVDKLPTATQKKLSQNGNANTTEGVKEA